MAERCALGTPIFCGASFLLDLDSEKHPYLPAVIKIKRHQEYLVALALSSI